MPTKTIPIKNTKTDLSTQTRPIKVQRKMVKPPVRKVQKVPTQKVPQVNSIPHPTATSSVAQKTEAERIWSEIKDQPITMFGLAGQTVASQAIPVSIEPSKLYVTIRASAALPAIETALMGRFTVEMIDKFIAITRATSSILIPKKG